MWGLSFSWTALGELYRITGTGIDRSFLYTADGERIVLRNHVAGTAAVTVRDLGGNPLRTYIRYASGSWAWSSDDINVGRLRVASVYASGVDYVHSDHLGSPRKITDASGNVKAYSDFYPFGLPAATNGIQPRWFSGYELEHQNTGTTYTDDLYFLHARWYSPTMARFLSPDPARGFMGLGQSFNLHGYVTNNPINLVDPWGLAAKEGGPGVSNVPQKDGWCSGNSEDPDCPTFHEEVMVFGAVPLVGFRGVAGLPGSWVQAIELYIDRYVAGDTFFGQIRATSDLRDWWATFRRGEYWGTGYGQRALDYYAGVIADPQAGLMELAGAYAGGLFAALWTPDTYLPTVSALLTGAGVAPTLARQGLVSSVRFAFHHHPGGPHAYPHLQAMIWRQGVKGSHHVWRVRLWW